jgi:Ca2+-binding EF-hand superfamily protein
MGPRARKRLAEMEAYAREMEDKAASEPPAATVFETTNSSAYVQYGRQNIPRKPRGGGGDRMRTGDALDMDSMSGAKTKQQLQQEADAVVCKGGYTKGTAISIYTETLRTGKGVPIVGSAAAGVNPFGRSSAFTNDIKDPTKRHVGATDEGGSKVEKIGPNMTQRAAFDAVKAKILSRGANGIKGVARVMRIMDDNGNKKLNMEEFDEGLRDYGLDLSKEQLTNCFRAIDTDGNGFLSFDEFLVALRGDMNKRRLQLVSMAYDCLDVTGDGCVTYEDIQQAYDVSMSPEVMSGEKTEREVLTNFMAQWDTQDRDGIITRDEFTEYYRNISASIDADDYFELMIRNAWHISGGEGAYANTTCRRVLVTHLDGSQEVCEIKNDLGLAADDIDGMILRLKGQGIPNIKSISLAD